ncbi:MAG TPA: RagB/SusD family nutrient uptake outer membrane protein [Candidatus Coprenecus stercorigallinarum]|nr:RagB/SusD family nutrient uptake outer membrane protein [Candidatus Coprenecus stercorigallinarum]
MKKILIISVMFSALVLTGCKDFLVQEPITSQSTEQLLSTYNGLNNATFGAYSPLASNSWYGGTYFILDADTKAGLAAWPVSSDFTSGRMMTGFTLNYNENSTWGLWSNAYYVISAANNVLEQLDLNGEELVSSFVSQQDLDNLRAECLFLRALSHFDLLRSYSTSTDPDNGVPVILITDKTSTEQPARNTIREVYDQIEKDLTDAEGLMAADYTRSGVSSPRAVATPGAIKALLARVYLYDATFSGDQSKYQLAADYATKVIGSGDYTMWTADKYSEVWGNTAGDGEVIFEVFGIKANGYDAYWEAPAHMTNPNGYADVCASPLIYDAYEANDVRGKKGVREGIGPNSDGAMFCTDPAQSSGDYWPMKYPGKGLGDVSGTPDQNNTIVLRLSEMYLIRAEALNHGAVIAGASALSDLNTIRNNRGATPATSAGDQTIWKEYMLEFCFEGQYWFTTARLATAGNTWAQINYTTTNDEASRRGTPSISGADNKFWAMPISRSERDVNKNLTQTKGF